MLKSSIKDDHVKYCDKDVASYFNTTTGTTITPTILNKPKTSNVLYQGMTVSSGAHVLKVNSNERKYIAIGYAKK